MLGLLGTDAVTGLAEVYTSRNAGSSRTLGISSYTVNDGNSGANYAVTTVSTTTGVITKAPLTITAVSNTKIYDATPNASAVPTVTGLFGTDGVTGLAEAYANLAVGSSKTLSVTAYTIIDGNGGNNYTVTTLNDSTGVINPGPFSKYVPVSLQGNTLVAGSGFVLTVQAADQYGNAVSSYAGPAIVAVSAAPNDPLSSLTQMSPFTSAGLGLYLGVLKTAGAYTLNASAGNVSGTSAMITVLPTSAAYFKVNVPSGVISGASFNVTVTAYDVYGNVASGYNGTVQLTGGAALHLQPLIPSRPAPDMTTARTRFQSLFKTRAPKLSRLAIPRQ